MKKIGLLIMMLLVAVTSAMAQNNRTITPVETDDKKPPQPTLHYYDKHGEPLKEPVLFLAELDTVTNVSAKPVYPRINGFSVGVNFIDAVFLAAGQSYANFDVSAEMSIYNWFFPVVECGVGFGSAKRGAGNYRNFNYTATPSPYFKVGFNYNFLYKSTPDYQVFLGLRAGCSPFSYTVKDVTVDSGYWDEQITFNLPTQHAFSIYGEALIGLKVKIWKQLSMGWTGRFHFNMHTTNGANSKPWFVPGYGTNSKLLFTYSLIWNFNVKDIITDKK